MMVELSMFSAVNNVCPGPLVQNGSIIVLYPVSMPFSVIRFCHRAFQFHATSILSIKPLFPMVDGLLPTWAASGDPWGSLGTLNYWQMGKNQPIGGVIRGQESWGGRGHKVGGSQPEAAQDRRICKIGPSAGLWGGMGYVSSVLLPHPQKVATLKKWHYNKFAILEKGGPLLPSKFGSLLF